MKSTLILSSGGIRQITMLLGAFRVPRFAKLVCRCSTILGTSAGALMGFVIACCGDSADLACLETNISHDFLRLTWWDIFFDILTRRDFVRGDEIKELLHKALLCVQPAVFDVSTGRSVKLHRDLVVGYVRHTRDIPDPDGNVHDVYEEKLFRGGREHDLDEVLRYVVGSASIIGVTTSDISDGGQMHVFPVRHFDDHIKGAPGDIYMISPYPMRELRTPISDDDASRLIRMFYSIFYGTIMANAGDDVRDILRAGREKSTKLIEYPRLTPEAEVYGAAGIFVACPKQYIASNRVLSLKPTQDRALLRVGQAMGTALVLASRRFMCRPPDLAHSPHLRL